MARFQKREGRFVAPGSIPIACPICHHDRFIESRHGFYGDWTVYTKLRCRRCTNILFFAGWKHLANLQD